MLSKTLVIQPLPGIGDMLWYLPYLRAIARNTPDKKISILTKPTVQLEKLLGEEEFVDECLTVASSSLKSIKNLGLIQQLRLRNFQSVWVLHHSPRYALISCLAGIKDRKGYGFGLQKVFLNSQKYLSRDFIKQGPRERVQALLNLHNIFYTSKDQVLKPSKESITFINARYGDLKKPWIIFGIGASQADKCWSLENFTELARLLKNSQNHSLFLLCSAKENPLGETLINKIKRVKANATLVSDLMLDQVTALLSQAKFYVGNCSGPLNLSACLNIPSFGLFGITETLNYTPAIISVTPPLQQPYLGMKGITPQAVLETIKKEGLA